MEKHEIHAALSNIIAAVSEKEAFAAAPGGVPLTPEAAAAPPMDPMAAAGGMPPMDPAAMGGMPMDPAMMGMPPMDPAAMGGMPMDPAMMGMPPMDPAAMGGMPPGGEMPMDPAALEGLGDEETIPMKVSDVRQLIDAALKATKMVASIAGKNNDVTPEDGTADKSDARIAALEDKIALITEGLGLPPVAPMEDMPTGGPTADVVPEPVKEASEYTGYPDILRDLDDIVNSFG